MDWYESVILPTDLKGEMFSRKNQRIISLMCITHIFLPVVTPRRPPSTRETCAREPIRFPLHPWVYFDSRRQLTVARLVPASDLLKS